MANKEENYIDYLKSYCTAVEENVMDEIMRIKMRLRGSIATKREFRITRLKMIKLNRGFANERYKDLDHR